MRLLEVITSAKWGGAQSQMLAVARHARRSGHEVHIACGEQGELHERANQAGLSLHRLRWLCSPARPAQDLLAVGELARLIRRLDPDVIHTHSSKAGVIGRIAPRLAGRRIPVVHHCHGLAWGPGRRTGLAAAVFRMAEAVSGGQCDGVVAVSGALAAEIREAGLYRRAEHVVIRNSVCATADDGVSDGSHISREAAREAFGIIGSAALVVALVGRLVPGKGHAAAIEALTTLARDGLDAHLLVAGDGPLAAHLAAVVAGDPCAAQRVRLLGFCRDVDAVLRASDVLCLPSAAESVGLVLLEAMAAGLPVVATGVPGMDEVVEHGRTGLLLPPPGRAGDLAAALRQLAEAPSQARAMGEAGRTKVAAEYSEANLADTVEFLNAFAGRRKGAAAGP